VAEADTEFRHTRVLSNEERVLWRRFVETHAAIVRRLDDDLRVQSGLTLSSFEVLYELVRAPGNRLRMAELADRLLFTRSGITLLSDRLARDDFVERSECPDDGRGVYARLTEKGFGAFEAAAVPHCDSIRHLFFDRLENDGEVLSELLLRLVPDDDEERVTGEENGPKPA
jgi:DNA-binding MarR family transcriptional regulator